MIADLVPYPAMKDSGVPWLGEVPEHWGTRRLKHAFKRIAGGSTPSSAESSFWDGDVVWVTPADISKNYRLGDSLRRITRDGLRSCSAELVPAGSLVVTSRAPVGNIAIAEIELCTNQGCKALVATPAVVDPMFGFHVLTMAKAELQSLGTGTTFTEVSTDRIGAVSIPLPPLSEQAAIVRFLGYADRRIRRYIRAKQKLIELLEEQKQAIIHRAVTRGLDPDVRLKPSGVEWLGDVPEHWKVVRLKEVTTPIEQGWSPQCDAQPAGDGEWGVLKVGCVNRDAFDERQNKKLPAGLEPLPGLEVRDGDVLVSRANTRELLGLAAVAIRPRHRLLLCDKLFRFRANPAAVDAHFLVYALRQRTSRAQIESSTNGASDSMQNIAQGVIRNLTLSMPPFQEQLQILDALRTQTAQMLTAISRAEREISLLREYRTRLIADVVTGKLDVREAAARLPDEVEEPEAMEEVTVEADNEGAGGDTDEVAEEAEV